MEKETIIGIEALKDKFRWAKLMVGDLRGLKNRFALGERLGVSGLQTFFHAVGGNGEYRMEVYVDIMPKGTTNSFWCYSIKDMVEEIMDSKETEFEVEFHYCKWNKARTDADRIRITMPILFKKTTS